MPQAPTLNLDRWQRLMDQWGFETNEDCYRELVDRYSENGRFYHTQEHVAACLRHLDGCIDAVNEQREVELALWFHDAVYNPRSGSNEKDSADWAASFLSSNGAPEDAIARVHRLVMATEHDARALTNDESLLVDIDLAILGADPETYDTFEKAIRAEYRHVPTFIYRQKRAQVLRGFLQRRQIFHNEPFTTEREARAQENLQQAVARLSGNT